MTVPFGRVTHKDAPLTMDACLRRSLRIAQMNIHLRYDSTSFRRSSLADRLNRYFQLRHCWYIVSSPVWCISNLLACAR